MALGTVSGKSQLVGKNTWPNDTPKNRFRRIAITRAGAPAKPLPIISLRLIFGGDSNFGDASVVDDKAWYDSLSLLITTVSTSPVWEFFLFSISFWRVLLSSCRNDGWGANILFNPGIPNEPTHPPEENLLGADSMRRFCFSVISPHLMTTEPVWQPSTVPSPTVEDWYFLHIQPKCNSWNYGIREV